MVLRRQRGGAAVTETLEKTLYDADYYAWTKEQAAGLRALAEARSNLPLDLLNLAEEVESLGRSDLRTCRSRIRRIIEHLLKLEYSPAVEPRPGWERTILDARAEIADVLTPTLARDALALLDTEYRRARRAAELALIEHGEPDAARALPDTCPYTFDQLIDDAWLPPSRRG